MTLTQLPTLNATLNALSAILVIGGVVCIRAKRVNLHVLCMCGAITTSAAFLMSYLWYHSQVGSVPFLKTGLIRPVYFFILITHTVLAVVIVPLVFRTVFLALRRNYPAHVVLARKTSVLWLYVSVSGIVVYWMLYHLR